MDHVQLDDLHPLVHGVRQGHVVLLRAALIRAAVKQTLFLIETTVEIQVRTFQLYVLESHEPVELKDRLD